MNKYYPIQYTIIEQYSDYLEEVIWIEAKSSYNLKLYRTNPLQER